MKKCLNCKKELGKGFKYNQAKRCHSCENKRRHHLGLFGRMNLKHGKYCQNIQRKCINCGKNLKSHGLSINCKSCAAKLRNPRKNIIKRDCFCNVCGKKLGITACYSKSIRCKSCAAKYQFETKGHPSFICGIDRQYPLEFSNDLKNLIRGRDEYTCKLCNKSGNHVHHINYNKYNCEKNNLITLCRSCHIATNSNRDYWYAYFTYIMEEFYEQYI
jgi:hypothetical protein